MKEMILPIPSWYGVFVSEEAIDRLPERYKRNKQEVHLHRCTDPEVIALAKEMKADFVGGTYAKGFKIVTWDETKVEPMFFENAYNGDTHVYFVPSTGCYDEDYGTYFIDDDIEGFNQMQEYLEEYETYYLESEFVTMVVHGSWHKPKVEKPKSPTSDSRAMKMAKYLDKTKPLKITKGTCLSLNPMSYLQMTQGSWASCHNIDKMERTKQLCMQ